MIIKTGDVIFIRHYSNYKAIKSIVVDTDNYLSSNDNITIKLTSECAELNMLEGDPVALTIQRNYNIYNTSCHVMGINLDNNTLQLSVDNDDFVINQRAFERVPVSLYALANEHGSEDKFIIIAKNISIDGLMISSKRDIEKGQVLHIKLRLIDAQITFSASIVWKMDNVLRYDYGLKIMSIEYLDSKAVQSYIENLIKESENLRRSL